MKNKVKKEDLHKEIDLIQSCITRMADNSFRLKEWYVSLVAIAVTVLISQECKLFIISAFLLGVSSVFWGLDAFFLKMETLYRWKYEWVITKRIVGEQNYLYDLNPHNRNMWIESNNKNECFLRFVLSKTLVSFYGVVVGIAIIVLVNDLIRC